MKARMAITVVAVFVVFLNAQAALADDCFGCYFDLFYWHYFCSFACPGSDWCYSNGVSCQQGGACQCGSGCFLPGTKVHTAEGLKAIEKLEIGDYVLGMDDAGTVRPCEVTRTYRSIGCSYYLINKTLRVTGTHPFLVNRRWVEASGLKIGDELCGMNREPIVVGSIEQVKKGIRAYNIEVAGTHTFFTEGVLVHNKGPDPFF